MKKDLNNKALKEKNAINKITLETQVQDLLSLISAFGALLTRETEALKKADFTTVDSLQEEKRFFAKQYHSLIETLSGRRDELLNLDLLLRENLVNARTNFALTLDNNSRALDAAQKSTTRLINRILEVARDAVIEERQTNYSNAGRPTTYKSASTSLSMDQSL